MVNNIKETRNLYKFTKPNFIDVAKDGIIANRRIADSNDWQTNFEDFNDVEGFFERFDTYDGLFNTQQLLNSIDFNDFSKHCFFNSAVSKVELAFQEIFNKFPIDGTKYELESFFKKIDGFQRNIYNQIDKNIGYLKFKGKSYIEVKNKCGYFFSLRRNERIVNKLTYPVLNPKLSDFSFDFRIFIEHNEETPNNQVIFQYLNSTNFGKNGFSLYIKDFSTDFHATYANVFFQMSNFNLDTNILAASFKLKTNSWQHVSINIHNNTLNHSKSMNVWIDGFEQNLPNLTQNFKKTQHLEMDDSNNFLIGKGLIHVVAQNFLLNNPNLFRGYLDEFRYLHTSIDHDWIIKNRDDNIYVNEQNDDLKLYFKFNEPTGEHENNNFCFDSSGNSLHSIISLFPKNDVNIVNISQVRKQISELRYNPQDTTQPRPSLKFEKDDNNPVILPNYEKNKQLNASFLEDAKSYDDFNTNLIFKLFPKHLFEESSQLLGLNETWKNKDGETYFIYDNLDTDLIEDLGTANLPASKKFEYSQIFSNLILIWAKFFDEIKLFIDIMPKLIDIDYSDINSSNNAVNFFLPLMAKNFGFKFKEIMKSPTSKLLDGYIIGADGVDKSEFTLRFIQNELWKRILVNSKDILQSKGTKSAIKSIFNSIGIIPEDYYRFREYGINHQKFIDKSQIQKIKNVRFIDFFNSQNNLSLNIDLSYLNNIKFTDDSFTIQFYICYKNYNNVKEINETLFHVLNKTNDKDLFKIKFVKKNIQNTGFLSVEFYRSNIFHPPVIIELEDINLLDQNISQICLTIDNSNKVNNAVKLTLMCQTCLKSSNIVKKELNLIINEDFLNIFNDELETSYLSNSKIQNGSNFSGQITNIKIWKNILTLNDIRMHSSDLYSLSNEKFQFLNIQKINSLLLLHMPLLDDEFFQINNTLFPVEFSERNKLPNENGSNHCIQLIGNGINPLDKITLKTLINYENDCKFDEPNIENRVNVIGYQDDDLATLYNAQIAPAHEVDYTKQKINDVRFSIEMSNVKHLNEDIGKLFNSIDFFADIISNFGTLNDPSYNKFEKFSDFYFQRIQKNIQITPLYNLYQIFDNILTEMLSDFISSRVKFKNNIYVIESHALERHKYHYKFMESHVVMKGDMNISSPSNSKKSFNYLKMPGRRLLH